MLVGISGRAGAGKDAVGEVFMADPYRCRRHALATKMKQCALAIDPIVDVRHLNCQEGSTAFVYVRLSDLISEVGPEQAKKHPEVRRLYQRIGTEMGRETLDEELWIKQLFAVARQKNIVITDVRFVNELRAIQKRGGFVFRVIRPDLEPLSEAEAKHISENQLTDDGDGLYDGFIINDGTLADLPAKVAKALSELGRV